MSREWVDWIGFITRWIPAKGKSVIQILKEPLYNKDIDITMEGGFPRCKCDTYEGVPKVKGCIIFREKEHIHRVLGLEGGAFITEYEEYYSSK